MEKLRNKTNSIIVRKRDILFYLSYVLLIIYRITKSSTIGYDDGGMVYVIIAVLAIARIFTLKLNHISLFAVCVSMTIVLGYLIRTGEPVVPIVFLMMVASKDIEFRNIVVVSYYTTILMLLLILFFCWTGVIPDSMIYKTIMGRGVACHGMGFNHFSALPTYYCFVFYEYNYLRKGKLGFFKGILWIMGAFYVFALCHERLRFYLIIAGAVLFIFERSFSRIVYKYRQYIIYAFPFLCVASIISGYFFNSNSVFMNRLNLALSNRLYLNHLGLTHYGIALFGRTINMGEESIYLNGGYNYFYLDCGYVFIFVVYGAIVAFMIIGCYIFAAYKAANTCSYALIIWFLDMAVDSLVGNQMMSIWSVPILFIIFCKCKSNSLAYALTTCDTTTDDIACNKSSAIT